MQPIKFKCRASKVGAIMTDPKEKNNMQKYIEAKERLKAMSERLAGFKDQNCKSAKQIREYGIPDQIKLIDALEKVKDVTLLSETCKTYLREWIIEKKYGRKKEFTSKPTDKGNATEQDGFQLIQDVLYTNVFLPKSRNFYENDYLTGNPDIEILDTVLDNKSSYHIFTFPFGETELSNKDNVFQIHSYMSLTGLEKGKVCYTLNNTPFEIVDSELKSWAWKNKIEFDEFPEDKAYEIIKPHIYTKEGLEIYRFVLGTLDTSDFIEIPAEKRVISFDFVKDEGLIQSINNRVVDCDNWVQENWDRF